MARGDTRCWNAGRAVKDKGGGDFGFVQQKLWLLQFQLEAHGPHIIAQQEFFILKGKLIGWAVCLRGGNIFLGAFRVLCGMREDPCGYFSVCHLA